MPSRDASSRDRPSKTLCVHQVPTDADPAEIQKLFAAELGFVEYRPVRRMAFITFDSEKNASSALRRLQGCTVQEGSRPLMISFDNARQQGGSYQDKRRKELVDAELAGSVPYSCVACGSEIMRLDASWPLLSSPRRSADAALAVEEKAALRKLLVTKAPAVNVWRPRDISEAPSASGAASDGTSAQSGTEDKTDRAEKPVPPSSASAATRSQSVPSGDLVAARVAEARHMLNCPRCDVPVAYRARPLGEPARFLFVLDGALTASMGVAAGGGAVAASSAAGEVGIGEGATAGGGGSSSAGR